MGVEALTQSVCDLALGFGEGKKKGEEKMSRPFGVALLMAGEIDCDMVMMMSMMSMICGDDGDDDDWCCSTDGR
jgi:hypothetical protein